MSGIPDLASVEAMDAADVLRPMRDRFLLPDGLIYLDGNSLGAASPRRLRRTAKGRYAGMGRGPHPELELRPAGSTCRVELGDRIGRLIGAAAGQTVVCDTTTRSTSTRRCMRRSGCGPAVRRHCRRRRQFPDRPLCGGRRGVDTARRVAAARRRRCADHRRADRRARRRRAGQPRKLQVGRAARHGGADRARPTRPARSSSGISATAPAPCRSTLTARMPTSPSAAPINT